MEFEIQTKKSTHRIEDVNKIMPEMQGIEDVYDMLRYYHDAGKVLYFNETDLADFVILDVQWFVDAFQFIITDKLHMKGIKGRMQDWEEYYQTGHLRDGLLTDIWRKRDLDLHKELLENDEVAIEDDIANDSRYLLPYKDTILMFMTRLGLVAVGEEFHYVPCINKKEIDSRLANIIRESKQKSSVLIFQFDFLPYFVFYRLIVSCMQEMRWKVLESEE
ncbi:Glycosyl transferases group 1, partial [Bonamia ostreae]